MRRALATLGVALTSLALALTACSGAHPTHGHVVGKTYEAARTEWSTVTKTKLACSTTSRGSRKATQAKRACSRVPVSTRRVAHHVPACWALHIDTGDYVCVTATKWHRARIGARY
ncbi:hypothetical protein ACH4UM_18710 [Streptomyces sp. NPDC020801]|uniref:hypothetical protein n=1 Tax=Streptomyces sp. NPDC020801 TaxID=3365093 RepID=UPI00379AC262